LGPDRLAINLRIMKTLALSTERAQWQLNGFTEEGGAPRCVALTALPCSVGRLNEQGLTLAFASVSKLHAEFFQQGGRLWLRDQGSMNGTFVNGERIASPVELKPGDTVRFGPAEFRVRLKSQFEDDSHVEEEPSEWVSILTQFDRLFDFGGAVPHYQPIVELADGRPIGYEILGRSDLDGLRTPKQMFDTARRLNVEPQLSELFRSEGVRQSQLLPGAPNLFVNTHPAEVGSQGLIESLTAIREASPSVAITLEIHEAAVTDLQAMQGLRSTLKNLGISLAYDDFGAGQARLVDLAEVPPDYLKFDIALVRDIHMAAKCRVQVLQALVNMTLDLGIIALAEGIECQAEADVCRELGFQLAQGFFYGRPAPAKFWAQPLSAG
jgi:EAL domain-containing protein (putative c-di-GMP-specific phosphodiesterase class I)